MDQSNGDNKKIEEKFKKTCNLFALMRLLQVSKAKARLFIFQRNKTRSSRVN